MVWGFNTTIVLGSPIDAWLYNYSGKITFVAVFYHALDNVMGEVIIDAKPFYSVGVEVFKALLLIMVAPVFQ